MKKSILVAVAIIVGVVATGMIVNIYINKKEQINKSTVTEIP